MGNSGGKTTKQEEILVGEDAVLKVIESSKQEDEQVSSSKDKQLRFSMPPKVDLEAETKPHSNVIQYVVSMHY
jgi:hypothetical protein